MFSPFLPLQAGNYEALWQYRIIGGLEPLYAVYSSVSKGVFKSAIKQVNGRFCILDILDRMNIRQITYDEVLSVGGQANSFLNVNTPEEYNGIR